MTSAETARQREELPDRRRTRVTNVLKANEMTMTNCKQTRKPTMAAIKPQPGRDNKGHTA